jgi:hypothetical protein
MRHYLQGGELRSVRSSRCMFALAHGWRHLPGRDEGTGGQALWEVPATPLPRRLQAGFIATAIAIAEPR